MPRVVHFEIHSPDPEKTQDFHEGVFGWKFSAWGGPHTYWLVDTGSSDEQGINGGLMPSRDGQPRTVNTVKVESVDDVVRKIEAHGGTIVVPKMSIPGVGYVAYYLDPVGVLQGVYHDDATAK
jgi:hypothetical protein